MGGEGGREGRREGGKVSVNHGLFSYFSFRLKIFAKCNQNCLKNAGNPKDSRRRFQVCQL